MTATTAIAQNVNTISRFLAKRDIAALTKDALQQAYGLQQADLLVLFGGSILHGCTMAGLAYQQGIAKRMMIVGGEGHTTDALRAVIAQRCPAVKTAGQPEAVIIAAYLQQQFGITDCILETQSSNCGNNVRNAWALLQEKGIKANSIIIMQDSSMQLRMDAIFKKVWQPADTSIINFAAYQAELIEQQDSLCFAPNEIEGLWDLATYIRLQMGEIPRLTDNEQGYGPKGKNFLVHIDIPSAVTQAYELLKTQYGLATREANERYK